MRQAKAQVSSMQRQQGVVIVVALFVVALVATMAYMMMARLERDTQRTSLILRDTEAELYAQGSIDWALETLRDNLLKQKPKVPVDKTPLLSPVNEVNGYKISSTIDDMQARFNLNNLNNKTAQVDFKRLIILVDPAVNQQQADEIVQATTDWIAPIQQDNEYNKYYMSLTSPYRAAHRPMVSASELQLVKGMTPTLYHLLEPNVTALPVPTLVNARSVLAPVLAAMSPTMTMEAGKAAEKARNEANIATVEEFSNLDIVKNNNIPADKITVLSNYFLVETTVSVEKQKVVLYTLLERTGTDAKNGIRIIWQSKGLPG